MSSSRRGAEPPRAPRRRRIVRPATAVGNLGKSFMDIDVVPLSLAEVAPFLRVAYDVESNNPRVAYLCRFRAFEKAHRLDPTSRGHGVRQFKTALLLRLEGENDRTLKRRVKQSDAQELQSFYEYYHKKYIQSYQNGAIKADHSQLTRASQTAVVLFDVLKAINLVISEKAELELVECAICLDNFGNGKEIKILPICGHSFHVACIDMWLSSHSSCPYCRRTALMPAPLRSHNGFASTAHARWWQWRRLLGGDRQRRGN